MALDGAMLSVLAGELTEKLLGARVDKVQQPSREELVITFRGRNGQHRLLISARAGCPRINITQDTIENPAQPPMLCMLLRKQITGYRLTAVRQQELDRILMLDLEGFSELGDRQTLTFIVEIMGRCSNAVLVDSDGKIIDALKRVDGAMSSARMIIPGLHYQSPPQQDKLNILTADTNSIAESILSRKEELLHKAILAVVQGVSPIIARELSYRVCRSTDVRVCELTEQTAERLCSYIDIFRELLKSGGQPTMVSQPDGKPFDVAIMRIEQYGTAMLTRELPDVSALLDAYSGGRDLSERMKVKSHDILKILTSATDRVARRLTAQRSELIEAQKRDKLRLYGDLINANIYRLQKGELMLEAENYYSEGETVRIPLDGRLTPAQNAQLYYKEYRRKQTAQAHLEPLIEQGERELEYLEAVFDALTRATTNGDVAEIRAELCDEGYIRKSKQNGSGKSRSSTLPPIKYTSVDGYEILVGRNNRQNDRLSLKDAEKTDIWFHASKIPGAHVIIKAHGEKVPERTMEEAAMLAAGHSRARESGLVAVDYTLARYVFKPSGSKPGMVNYTNQRTVYVKPRVE